MVNTNLLFANRLYGFLVAYGHAMPCDSKWNICDVVLDLRLRAPITSVAQGITMPISRGGPPVLTE